MDDASGSSQTLVTGLVLSVIPTPTVELSQGISHVEECVHFWIIDTPSGPTSQGVCKLCGKNQLFRNSVSSSAWNKGIAKREGSWGGV